MKMKLHELVLENWQKHGNRKAIVYDDGKQKHEMTYQKMFEMSRKMMECFADNFCPGEVVGLCLKQDHHLPVVLLSVLSCDVAFYNMDMESPEFVGRVLEELGVRFVVLHKDISQKLIRSRVSQKPVEEVPVPSVAGCVMFRLGSATARVHSPSLAYCITTSGTTGTPKVVKVPHACIVPNITHLREILSISPDDLVFLASPLTFDPSIVEIFTTLCSGACLLCVPDHVKMTPDLLLDAVYNRNKVSVMQLTPALLSRFTTNTLPETLLSDNTSLRVMALGGERFPALSLMKKLRSPNNRTRFFNLYGTTEVSCWASYYRITEEDFENDVDVPIGQCLQDTHIEVRDANEIVKEGAGELFIGGTCRQCVLTDDEEETFYSSRVVMRSTGDIVDRREDGHVYYLGRTDRQLKRNGKRINLEEIKLVACSVCEIRHSEVIMISDRLVLFVIRDSNNRAAGNVGELIKTQMAERLPRHSIPDDVIVTESLPVTKHGKVDMKKLEAQFADHWRINSRADPVKVLTQKWKELLGVVSHVPYNANFVTSGGNSLKAVHLLNDLEHILHVKLPELLDIILQKTFSDALDYIVYKQKKHNTIESNQNLDRIETNTVGDKNIDFYSSVKNSESVKHNEDNSKSDYSAEQISGAVKRKWTDTQLDKQVKLMKYETSKLFHSTISRGSRVVKLATEPDSSTMKKLHDKVDGIVMVEDSGFGVSGVDIKLQESWKYDTGKCVDASPLLALSRHSDRDVVYIGSHSHTMSAILLSTGELLWEVTLPDRVESSACLSLCGKFVIVGCYDGQVYSLQAYSGDLWWSHDTGAEVKSSPTVDRITGLVYIGSHSRILYCLDVEHRRVVWEVCLQAGSIFSSPAVYYDPHHVYVGTLGGKVAAISARSGAVVWQTSLGRPVFASPAVCNTGVCVGCTDNTVYFLSHSGHKMWSFTTEGPVFSSPVIVAVSRRSHDATTSQSATDKTENKLIIFGCHDNSVYCLSLSGKLVRKVETNSSVYSTPFVSDIIIDKCTSGKGLCGTDEAASSVADMYDSIKKLPSDGKDLCNTDKATSTVTDMANNTTTRQQPSDSKGLCDVHKSTGTEAKMTDSIKKQSSDGKDLLYTDEAASTVPDRANNIQAHSSDSRGMCDIDKATRTVPDMAGSVREGLPVAVFSSSKGTVYLVHACTGAVLGQQDLPYEVFSSPIVYDNKVIVGCRNNYVYCLTVKAKTVSST